MRVEGWNTFQPRPNVAINTATRSLGSAERLAPQNRCSGGPRRPKHPRSAVVALVSDQSRSTPSAKSLPLTLPEGSRGSEFRSRIGMNGSADDERLHADRYTDTSVRRPHVSPPHSRGMPTVTRVAALRLLWPHLQGLRASNAARRGLHPRTEDVDSRCLTR